MFGVPLDSTYLWKCFNEISNVEMLCSEGEIQLYVKSIHKINDLPPTHNCNQTHWSKGCDAGWASPIMDLNVSESVLPFIPTRSTLGRPCCEGFFCPQGLNCMLPCPRGAFCPRATFNQTTGLCEPYRYQLRPDSDVVCGGANSWSDVLSTPDVFCQTGNYCNLPSETNSCDLGYYCRLGSTSQAKCYHFTVCNQGSSKQNLLLYGVFLMVMLGIMLLVIYGCSDQLMTFREKCKSKARERALELVRDNAFAKTRWNMAKEKARQHTRNLSNTLRLTFSQKHSKSIGDMQILSPPQHKSHNIVIPGSIMEERVHVSPTSFRSRKTHSVIDEDLYSQQFVPPQVYAVEPEIESPIPYQFKNTTSQVLKYAFSEIEKEKAIKFSQNDQKRAMESIKKLRPPIDLMFKNLSLYLKKGKKEIISDVTGKFSHGNITAIMGPSGAGKSTFLNAVAGKSIRSYMTGHIYINVQEGSIQSYRKIIGFVPQDDILHGGLTVEENIWFSATYRYDGVWLITRCGLLLQSGYRLDRFNFCIGVLVTYGSAARLVALLCLILCH